ncbi:hypothetical protein HYFRA_00014173 [Hymenoscyphus fraxineus]|uniref:GH64 domain-containing protein n=1 Tax=Hymenoscyphus fraxineus TaxID=746836 RepID=A0A9N9LDM2_9HELO|nr:hypothetical protein HYFRA_00014172 [Hymenoscyphus fraxineus]CAG8962373.1 hypothetical protein HYFRA_00014173 [Hymenoscyphus fraxineus]
MTPPTLQINLRNTSTAPQIYAYITGLSLVPSTLNQRFLLQADGQTPYFPSSPSRNGVALAADCGIPLGGPGTERVVRIPWLAGGRVYFCYNERLTFLLNPGPGLVEPSVSNPSDPNYTKTWGFCEFTYNTSQLFANITYVDFVSIPISLSLLSSSGVTQTVLGLPSNGIDLIANDLIAQSSVDGTGWKNLVVRDSSGSVTRVLSPNTAHVMDSSLLKGYYDDYVNAVWNKYTTQPLVIDTQAQWGLQSGTITSNLLTFPQIGTFSKPSATDIFSCSTGPFSGSATNTVAMGALTARIAAAFNRSTLLIEGMEPKCDVETFYGGDVTNVYARCVHRRSRDGRGYAFPYDDVAASGQVGGDQAGTVADGRPMVWGVSVGGLE